MISIMSRKRSRNSNAIRRMVKKEVAKSAETKTLITQYANSVVDSARATLSNSISGCIQGVDQDERVGNRVTITSMKYDWFFTGADTTNSIRVLIYIPKDPTTVIAGLPFNQPPDLDQFTILKDLFVCTSQGGPDCVRRQGWIRFNKGNRRGMTVEYSGNLATEIVRNKLMVYMVSDSTAALDPQVNGFCRVFFKDS